MISCPLCGGETRVMETRGAAKSVRRRRACTILTCSGKVTTVEVIVPDRKATSLASGSVVVSAKLIQKLQQIVAAIDGDT